MQKSSTKQLCKAADNTPEDVIQISSTREFLELSTISYRRVKHVVETPREAYRRKLFIDAIEDMGFFFQQYRISLREDTTDARFELLKEKMASLLDFLEEDLSNATDTLHEQLNSYDEKTVAVVSYILASVSANEEDTPHLNKVLAEFTICDDERLPYFLSGLSHGTHPKLISSLKLIKEMASENVQQACEIILQNRMRNICDV
ncbi:MAG: hypothetical protein MJE63_25990 [Proteobacteria bacterium]|nr:hypothetical protein [Pseudomonadota bacterium]